TDSSLLRFFWAKRAGISLISRLRNAIGKDLSHCAISPMRLEVSVIYFVRDHLLFSKERNALRTFFSNVNASRSTATSSRAWQAPCPLFGVVACPASPIKRILS